MGQGLDQGRRGQGGQVQAAAIWGLPVQEYLDRADVWPLNPNGEIMLGLKIENRCALANVEFSTAIPGIAFAEWGPGDTAKVAFLNSVNAETVVDMINEGVRVCAGQQAAAEIGRHFTKRTMAW